MKLDLACQSDFIIGMIGASYFIGWASTLLILPRLSDLYGRAYIYRTGMVCYFTLICCYYFCSNVYLMIALNFCLGSTATCRMGVGFVYMQEFVKSRHQTLIATAFGTIDGFTYLTMTMYFVWIS
jgi:MFS family permease